jgi:hypothetical protein
MKFVLMFLFLVTAGGIANADPYVYTLTGTASGFYLPSATYNPGQAEPVAFADQPFRLTLDANVENIGLDGAETWVETQAAVSIGALAGSLAPHFVLSTLDHSDVDFSIAYFWYSSGKIISMHPQAPGFDRQGPFDFGDSVGSEPVGQPVALFRRFWPTDFHQFRHAASWFN